MDIWKNQNEGADDRWSEEWITVDRWGGSMNRSG